MNLKKYILLGGVALTLGGLTSGCVGDLDQEPNDPNYGKSTDYLGILGKCYSGMAVSGQSGPGGGSDVSGLDGGTGCYSRAIFMMEEFPTDELIWIWKDFGVFDLVQNTWDSSNGNIYGTYSRLYSHIAVCNDFLRLTGDKADEPKIRQMRTEARALRAMSYFWVIDIFGNTSFCTELDAIGASPSQATRADLYTWLAGELEDVISEFKSLNNPVLYGRVGLDGAQALLARLYLNAEVYAGTKAYDKAARLCSEIISRHQGRGYRGTGLASNYYYLFCATNDAYMPGGSNADGQEILWGIPYDAAMTQSYGGSQFVMLAAVANNSDGWQMASVDYGINDAWKCMHGTEQMSEKFGRDDLRAAMWLREAEGFIPTNDEYSEFNNGYANVKFTNLIAGNMPAVSDPLAYGFWSPENGGKYDATGAKPGRHAVWVDTDLPLIRLADVYLMYAECALRGAAGADYATALTYVNYLRSRAGISAFTAAELTLDTLLDERCRELYWEMTRRSDLIRFGKFTGRSYNWAWKRGVLQGDAIPSYYNLMPIPAQIMAAQPDFKQNPGY